MKPTAKEITIYDIAEKLNVSGCTVSRALQNNPLVNRKTSQQIQEMAKMLGYRTNQFARNLRSQRTNTIGVIVPRLDDCLISKAIVGMEKVASRFNLNLIVKQSFEIVENELGQAADLFESRVDGILIFSPNRFQEMQCFTQFTERGNPVVFLDAVPMNGYFTSVSIDHQSATKKAITHLVNEGCKNVMFITANGRNPKDLEPLEGYKDALRLAGIPYYNSNVIYNNLSYDAGIEAASTILKMKSLPDGVFVANDICAVGCMKALKNAGISIPNEIAFAACDHFGFATLAEPNLTTINNPGYAMGEAAIKYVINNLNNEFGKILIETISIQPELIVRKSSMKKLSSFELIH